MRKWLVGLLAAGLCLSSAWADTVTYTVTSKTAVEVSGTAPEGSSAEYAADSTQVAQISSNKTATLTLKGFAGTTITGLTLSMKSNSKAGSGSLSVTCGDAIIASIEDSAFKDGWSDAYTTAYVDVTPGLTATAVADNEDVVITINGSVNSLYCQSYTIEYTAGDPVFSVKFDKENWFKVAQGQASSVTAIPQYGIEPYTFLWESDTPELNGGTTDTLEIPATLAEGDYTVLCQVTDDNGAGDVINALIGFTVEAIPVITGGSATYTVTGKSKVEASGDVPTGSTAEYSQTYGTAGQATKENSMTLTLKGYEGMTITGLTLSMKSNKSSGSGSLSVTCEDAVIASIEDSAFNVGWSDAYTQEYVDVTPEVTPTAVTGDVTITIAASVNSLYCQSYTVQFEAGEPGLGVTFDKANGFTVDLGTPDSITATAKNGVEPYTYAWTSDTPDLNGTGETLAIPATLAAGDYTVMVTVTDADSNVANKLIGFTVVATYTVSVADGIENGSVELEVDGAVVESPAQLAAGTQVTVVATAAQGYQLDQILLNGQELAANPFTVEGDAEISATFSEKPVLPGVTYTITGTNSAEITSGEAPEGSSFEYASTYNKIYQLTAPNSMTLTLKGYEGQKVTGLTLSMHSNGSKGSGSLSAACGDATIASIADSAFKGNWYTDYTTNWVAVTPEVTATEIDGDIVITITASVNSLYCESITVEYEAAGPATPSIAYTGETEKTLPDAAFELVFTLKNYEGDYSWSLVDGEGTLGEGGVYTWTATEAGEYTIKVAAVNGELTIAQKEVTLTAVATYTVSVADGIENGSVELEVDGAVVESPAQLAAGTQVTVVATAAQGYQLDQILLNGQELAANPFTVEGDAEISATFEEFEVPPYYFQFESNDLPTAYSATEANVANTGSTAEEFPTVPFALQRAVRGNASGDKTVGAAALRLAPIGETNAFAYNSAAFSEAITAISFQYGIYGTSDKCDSFTVSTSEDGEEWTVLADLTATATSELQTFESSDLPDNTLFIRFDATNTVAGNSRRMDIDEIQLWTGAPSPKIVYSGETTIALGDTFEIIFGLLNYEGDFEWVLDSREGGSIVPEGRDGLYTWTPTEATGDDGVKIKVVARNGELDIASKEVTLTVTEPGPQPGQPALVFGGDTTGTVGTPVNFTVMSVNVVTDPTVYPDGFDASGAPGSQLTDDDIDYGEEAESRNVSFTPDVPGEYVFTFVAGAEGAADEVRESVTITVTGESPQPGEAGITKMTIAAGKMTIEFFGEGAQVLLSDDLETWTPVDGAVSPYTIEMGSEPQYIGVR